MGRALDGVGVLDLTMNLPGPYMTWLLAELGAEVLKVENPQGGDYARALTLESGASPVFEAVNRKKKSLALNLKEPAGREIFLKLLDRYDVLVEGFRPGVMTGLGLDYAAVGALRPRVIYVSISGYGQGGPYRLRGGHDLNYLSLAGVIGLTGTRAGELAVPGIQIADLAAGSLMSMAGLLAALYQREKTGQGQFVDAAMYDGSFALTVISFCTMMAGLEKPAPGRTMLTGGYPFYGLYRTKDGRHMSLGAVEFKFWSNFCLAVGRPDLVAKQFGGPEVIEEVTRVFAGRTQAEWIEFLKDVDACCEPVLTMEEAVASELARARGLVDQRADGRRFVAPPLKLSGSPRPEDAPPPRLGQHTREILAGLGYSEGDLTSLSERGVI
ncbi:MAG: CaiB/BaiF CoA-transferase family protein [Thermodesulfobacteriota bacterium]